MIQTLALCMIVKDEEQYLAGCLESVAKIVDQIVIVDTGSNDGTVDIARNYNAEIYHFNWGDDFSAARNESIKYAHADWILWMDADERLRPDSAKEMVKRLRPEAKPVIYRIQINSSINDGASVRLSSAHRLFTNNKGIHFTGKIHEQISISATKIGAEERESNIIIDHLGYDLSGQEKVKKNERNLNLLERGVREEPNNAYVNYTLAQQCALNEDWEKAIKYYEIAYRLNQFDQKMQVSLLNTMGEAYLKIKKYEKAQSLSEESIKLEPLQVGGYYLLYRLAEERNDTNQAIYWLERLLEKNHILAKHVKTISTDVLINESRIFYVLGLLYKKINHFDKAIKYFEKFVHKEPNRIEAKERLVEIYLQSGEWLTAGSYLQQLLEINPANENYIDLLGVLLIKQQKFSDAITYYETTLQRNPQNKLALKRLVGLYGKVGEFDKANNLMEAMQH